MKSIKDKDLIKKIADIVFWTGIILEFIVSFSGYAYGGYHEPVIILMAMVCFSMKIVLSIDYSNIKKFIMSDAIWYVIILGYGVICYVIQGSALILRVGLVLLSGRNQKAKDVIKFFFWGTIGVMLITAMLSIIGLHNELCVTDLFRHVPETRYCFGFYHPNGFALFLVRVIIMGIYLYGEKLVWWKWLIASLLIVPLLVMVNSKMAFVCVFVIVLISFAIRIGVERGANKDSLILKGLYMFGILIILSELIAIAVYCLNYSRIAKVIMNEDNLWYYINAVTSGRLFNAAEVWSQGLPNFFGVKELINGTEIGFFNALYGQGIVFIVVYLIIQFYLYIWHYRRCDYFGMLLVLGFAIYSLSEAFIPYINKNAVWMLLIGIENRLAKQD